MCFLHMLRFFSSCLASPLTPPIKNNRRKILSLAPLFDLFVSLRKYTFFKWVFNLWIQDQIYFLVFCWFIWVSLYLPCALPLKIKPEKLFSLPHLVICWRIWENPGFRTFFNLGTCATLIFEFFLGHSGCPTPPLPTLISKQPSKIIFLSFTALFVKKCDKLKCFRMFFT